MQIFPGRLGFDDVSDIMGEYKDLKVEVGEANSVRLNGIQETMGMAEAEDLGSI